MPETTSPATRPRVTVVTPVFNEQENLPFYVSRVSDALLGSNEYEFQVLFVDDGSSDHSWDTICEISRDDPRFSGIRLSRNYGSHIALSAGFCGAGGDAITTLACDLQDPPEVILDFLREWRGGAKIVWGRRRSRQDATWRAATSRMFQWLLTHFAMPKGSKFTTGSFFLADRLVVKCFNQFQEHHRITFAIVAWTGFPQSVVDYDRLPRIRGQSKWVFRQMLKAMYDAFIGFSVLPIRLMTFTGATVFLLAIGILCYLLFSWFVGHPAPGWTSQMLLLAFFFGLQFLLMGITGEYLYRIYTEVVRRPLYFVSDRTGGMPDENG